MLKKIILFALIFNISNSVSVNFNPKLVLATGSAVIGFSLGYLSKKVLFAASNFANENPVRCSVLTVGVLGSYASLFTYKYLREKTENLKYFKSQSSN